MINLACLTPLKAFVVGLKNNGKKELILTDTDVRHLEILNNTVYYFNHPYRYFADSKIITECMDVPCGKCLACKLDRARDWTCRNLLELQQHDKACFVTLTYDDIHVPRTMYAEPTNGEVAGDAYTLVRRDLQLFLKRLRKKHNVRYFACGEYGDTTARPHYHMILYGYRPDDLEFFNLVRHNPYYTSDELTKLWGKGHVMVGDVSSQSIGYVARYTTKKLYGEDAEYYQACNLLPPFLACSLKPAIGYQALMDNMEQYADAGRIVISTDAGGKTYPLPRYFYKLLAECRPDLYDMVIERAIERISDARHNLNLLTDLNYYDMLRVKLLNLEGRTSSLVRNKL